MESLYLVRFVETLAANQETMPVDFSADPEVGIPGQNVSFPLQKLVLGWEMARLVLITTKRLATFRQSRLLRRLLQRLMFGPKALCSGPSIWKESMASILRAISVRFFGHHCCEPRVADKSSATPTASVERHWTRHVHSSFAFKRFPVTRHRCRLLKLPSRPLPSLLTGWLLMLISNFQGCF